MTESEPPQDARHEELANKIATLEARIVQKCQQVQALTNTSAQQQTSQDHDGSLSHCGKRLDQKDSPRKHKNLNNIQLPQVLHKIQMSQRQWTEIVSQCGMIIYPIWKMICRDHITANTARVTALVATEIDTDQTHSSSLQRLSVLADVARGVQLSRTQEPEDMANSLTAYNATKPPPIGYTSLQPPLVPPSHSPAQRLSIAKAAWNNLFSKEHTDSFPRQPSSHSLRTARIATTTSKTDDHDGKESPHQYLMG
jgi:hypothetical protein